MPLFENEAIFAAAPAPMLIVGVDRPSYTVIDVNDAYLAATNRPRAALVGLPLFQAMPDNPEDEQATGVSNLRSSIDRAIATKRPDTMAVQKYDITHPDGGFEERWWDPVNSPMLGPDGEVIAVIHHVSDATERVRADQALRRLNDTLEAQVAQRTAERDRIWKLSPNLLLVAKLDGTIVSASPAWESILGWSPEWLAGRNAAESSIRTTAS